MDHRDHALEGMLTDDRLSRIDAVLNARLSGLTVLLEELHKPQNMGACIRSLEAIGIQNVHIIEGDEPFVPNPKITQGCQKWVDIHCHDNPESALRALRAQGYRILVAAPDATQTLDQLAFDTRACLCFGNELEGISPALVGMADETFHIPMTGFTQSFNISVALAICVQQAAESRRRSLGTAGDLTLTDKAALRSRWLRLGRKGSPEILAALGSRAQNP